MQYEVQVRDGAKCGGAYVKVWSALQQNIISSVAVYQVHSRISKALLFVVHPPVKAFGCSLYASVHG